MKATILGLVVSTAAFGATTVYFWQQFSQVRAQADQVAEANRRLNARVAELEQAREQFMSRRAGGPGGNNPFIAGMVSNDSPGPVSITAASSDASGGDGAAAKGAAPMVFNRMPMPPSMIKTMRNQVRAQNAKTYFDLKDRLGLTQKDADKLLDLITEQQTGSLDRQRNPGDPAQGEAMRTEWQRIDGEIADLLGPAKAAEYSNYKNEMPARMEVAMLAQQFESSEAPLSDQQRTRLVKAMSEEREAVPMPGFSQGEPDQYRKQYEAWQADYEQRVAERARTILNSSQLTVYDEYQQFQKDMRAQMAAQGRLMPGPGVMMSGPGMRMRMVTAPPPPPPKPN